MTKLTIRYVLECHIKYVKKDWTTKKQTKQYYVYALDENDSRSYKNIN